MASGNGMENLSPVEPKEEPMDFADIDFDSDVWWDFEAALGEVGAAGGSCGVAPPVDEHHTEETPSTEMATLGFKNRKVTMQGGVLQVSEEMDDRVSTASNATSIMGAPVEDLENVYVNHRDAIVDKDMFISTPLHIVKTMVARTQHKLHIEHCIMKSPDKKHAVHRVEILVGPMRGVGQCTRKQLARQLAAVDILEKLQQSRDDGQTRPTPIPKYGLLPGWRVDSMVYKAFHVVCQKMDLPSPTFTTTAPEDNKLGKSTVTCRVGKHVTEAENDHPWLAKKLAAKEMYELLTGGEFPVRETLVGNEVLGFTEMKLLGFKPKVSATKRKWMLEHRMKDSQLVVPADEPDGDDDEMVDDIEAEFQRENSKKLKVTDLKRTLKVTVNFPASSTSSSEPMREVDDGTM